MRQRILTISLGLVAWCLVTHWPADHWITVTFWTVVLAYLFFCLTSLFHEAAHQTVVPSRWANIWGGRCIGTLMFVSYTAYRETHIRHHAYLNQPHDWELWPYADPHCSRWFRILFVWMDLLLGVVTAPLIYARIALHRDSPLTAPKIRRQICNEYIACMVFWSIAFSLIAANGAWMMFLRIWVIPWLIAGFLQTGRKLTEHLGMESFDPIRGTRTVHGDSWLTKGASFLNFEIFIHGPHHRYPRVPHRELSAKLAAEQQRTEPANPLPVYPSYRAAVFAMLPHLFLNPGCGENAGLPFRFGATRQPARNPVDAAELQTTLRAVEEESFSMNAM